MADVVIPGGNTTTITPVVKSYLDKDGLQAYHNKIKEALQKRALKTDLEAYLKKVEASEVYVTKIELDEQIDIDPITDEEINNICD